MRHKPEPPKPTKRWDDPELTITGKSGREYTAQDWQWAARSRFQNESIPTYDRDPTYNLRRQK